MIGLMEFSGTHAKQWADYWSEVNAEIARLTAMMTSDALMSGAAMALTEKKAIGNVLARRAAR